MLGLGLGVIFLGLATGLSWQIAAVQTLDRRGFNRLNGANLWAPLDGLWAGLRPIGRTWFLLLVLTVFLLWMGATGLVFAVAALVAAGFERGVKLAVGRQRPYQTVPGAQLRLGAAPNDPSFPSGDAIRGAFLVAAAVFGLRLPWEVGGLLLLVAALVAAGRVRAGVHFPLDVWAGFWVGFGFGLAASGLLPGLANLSA
jgi:undecaprenyl-diphosphatase